LLTNGRSHPDKMKKAIKFKADAASISQNIHNRYANRYRHGDNCSTKPSW